MSTKDQLPMKTHEFTLILAEIHDATAETLYGACSDASVGAYHGTPYVASPPHRQPMR